MCHATSRISPAGDHLPSEEMVILQLLASDGQKWLHPHVRKTSISVSPLAGANEQAKFFHVRCNNDPLPVAKPNMLSKIPPRLSCTRETLRAALRAGNFPVGLTLQLQQGGSEGLASE